MLLYVLYFLMSYFRKMIDQYGAYYASTLLANFFLNFFFMQNDCFLKKIDKKEHKEDTKSYVRDSVTKSYVRENKSNVRDNKSYVRDTK